MKKNVYVGVVIVVLIVIAVIGGLLFLPNSSPQNEKVNDVVVQASSTPLINYTFPTNLDKLEFDPQYSEITPTIKNAYNLSDINKAHGVVLSAAQQSYLDKNKFILIPLSSTKIQLGVNFDEMEANFASFGGGSAQYRDQTNAKLYTPDIVLHAYHKYFDDALKTLESRDLTVSLQQFLTLVNDNIAADLLNASGETVNHLNQLTAQVAVARTLLANQNPPKPDFFKSPEEHDAYANNDKTIDSVANAKKIIAPYLNGLPSALVDAANQELTLIYSAQSVTSSPLYGAYNTAIKADYTQYTPRSHYTESSALRAYFRTMMYLGRNTYYFKSDNGLIDSNLLSYEVKRPSTGGVAPYESWKKIMDLTGFFAGESDDVTFTEFNNFVSAVVPGLNPVNGTAQNTIKTELSRLAELRTPKILSDVFVDGNVPNMTKEDILRNTMGLRIFGQRFTLDAWTLNSLTAGQEKTDVRLPSMPSALFVSAALGNKQAANYADTFLKNDSKFNDQEISGFNTKLTKVQQDLKKVSTAQWYNSMSSSWLYVLASFSQVFGKGYPQYMQSVPFQDKNIQTALGSFTELKHDTLLYAKQSYAELGAGGEEGVLPPIVRGFVEPNVIFWHKFQTLVDYTLNVFKDKKILEHTDAVQRLSEFKTDTDFLTTIAEKELTGKIITDDEYEKMRVLSFVYMVRPTAYDIDPTQESAKTALVADIHTDGLSNKILYEATGRPYLMIALVGDNQQPRAVIGLVYNHYEFTGPLGGNRITDENWKTSVYDKPSTLPAKNFWYNSLLVK